MLNELINFYPMIISQQANTRNNATLIRKCACNRETLSQYLYGRTLL